MTANPPQQTRTEAQIIPIARQAGQSAACALETTYRDRLPALVQFLTRRLGAVAEAQDLAQAAFLRLWQKRESLQGEDLSALLFVTARNLATDHLRSRRNGRLSFTRNESGTDPSSIGDEAPSAERVVIARREVALVRSIIDELPEKCRTAFIAYKFKGLEYGQIALQMGLTESMVRKYVRRALIHCVARYADLEGWE